MNIFKDSDCDTAKSTGAGQNAGLRRKAAALQIIRLVAEREIRSRLDSRAFRVTTLLLLVAVVGLTLLLKFAAGADSAQQVGLTPEATALASPLAATAETTGQKLSLSVIDDRSAGEEALLSGSLKALITGAPSNFQVVVKQELDLKLSGILALLARQQALDRQIESLGGDPDQVGQAVDRAGFAIQPLEEAPGYDGQRLALGTALAVLIFLSLQIYGQLVAQGVVEEKSSRVVELLLATLRPWQLMAGKVLGIGCVGLLQLTLVGAAGLAASLRTGVLDLEISSAAGILLWLVVWYLIGFLMYALVLAAAAALVSRQEEVSGVTTPIVVLVAIPYVLAVTILPSNPDSRLIETLSLLPLSAPVLMPVRLAMGNVPVWEAALALALALALIPALILLSGRIYQNTILRTGARVRLKDALRG